MAKLFLLTVLIVFPKHLGCEPLWTNSFRIGHTIANNSIILGEIIINYSKNYFDEDEKFFSMISKSSNVNQSHLHVDFSDDLFSILYQAQFPRTVFDQLSNATYSNRHAFNLIVVDDINILP